MLNDELIMKAGSNPQDQQFSLFVDVSKDYFILMCSYLCQLCLCNPFMLPDVLHVITLGLCCSDQLNVFERVCSLGVSTRLACLKA